MVWFDSFSYIKILVALVDYNFYLGMFKGMIQEETVLCLTLVCRNFIVESYCSC